MSKPSKIIVDKVIGIKPEATRTSITEKDAILYALGIGFSQDPLREQDFKYTNEYHSDFTTFPTVGVVLPRANLIAPLLQSQYMPAFSPFQILHAQHKLTLVQQSLEVGTQYVHQRQLIDCADKGKNAFILFQGNSYKINDKGQKQLAFQVQTLIFIKGLGGFNFEGKGFIKPALQLPKRPADWKLTANTYANQAFIYRLCFDYNPLHIDPNISKAQNFDRPILHGLAFYGTVARVIVQQLLNNDPTRFKAMQARFVGHVYPGETLEVSVWKEDNRYIYEAGVKERKTKALIGYIETRPEAKL